MSLKTEEWRRAWPLPLTAMLGIGGSAVFAYSNGVFMLEMTRAFGWTRTQFSSAFALQTILGLAIMPFVGRLIDRVGPRKVALGGIVPYVLSLSILGTATGVLWQWILVCVFLGISTAFIAPTVWVTAVVGRFRTSRGLALAVALAGVGLSSGLSPILAAYYVKLFGWRVAFPALAVSWAVLILPLATFCFFGSRDLASAESRRPVRTVPYAHLFKTRTFFFLTLSGSLLCCVVFGLTLHIVPILRANGVDPGAAAGVAGVLGVFAIVGRIGTGYLLDILPSRPLSTMVFTLPIFVAALLRFGNGSVASSIAAVALLGLAAGAETDIVTFLAAREFGNEVFASIYSVISSLFAVFAGSGPILASATFDATGSYDLFLLLVVPIVIAAAALICALPAHSTVRVPLPAVGG